MNRPAFVAILVLSANIIPLCVADENDDRPIVPEGFSVETVAREPMVSNPCAMAFDRLGRICIGQGPQYRTPKPETPGDRVDILIDTDGDGIADRRKTFAKGFNCIQGLAWHGDDLWVANSPELTVVRDTNGDDVADVYIRVYTDLGNLEHGLHGLNFGPDGKLYMSKGNSKGHNRSDHFAPRAFRELWGLAAPPGATDYPSIEKSGEAGYNKTYHDPADDWGQQGGILRCEPYQDGHVTGRELEIVSRGFRNPWDISFDDGFNWLGTDNDQATGDRIFMPFFGAHFGWGHPWSYSWTGKDHLPTVPISAPTFEGSGTGVVYYHADQFPKEYRGVFFVGDWLRRELLVFKPHWSGALMVSGPSTPAVFAHAGGGRTLPKSEGRAFDPTDIEVGPDGCLYVLSWGHEYGAKMVAGKQANVGRVYRIRFGQGDLRQVDQRLRSKPHSDWSLDELFQDLGSSLPAWRVNAQSELLRRKDSAKYLLGKLSNGNSLNRSHQTWSIWTLARMGELPDNLERLGVLNIQIQHVRALAFQFNHKRKHSQRELATARSSLVELCTRLLKSSGPRLRFEAVQAIGQAKLKSLQGDLLAHLEHEEDRLTFYSTWNVLRELIPVAERRRALQSAAGNIKLGLLLGLLADDVLEADTLEKLRTDANQKVASTAEEWLVKTGGSKPLILISPAPGTYNASVQVKANAASAKYRIVYTLDGSIPTKTSSTYRGPISLNKTTTVTVAILNQETLIGRVVRAKYQIQPQPEYMGRRFITSLSTPSGRKYEVDYQGLEVGKHVYTDRQYYFTKVPVELAYQPFVRGANNDDRSSGDRWLKIQSDVGSSILVGVDSRNKEPLSWMKIGEPDGFVATELRVETDDADFQLFRKRFPPGEIVLGGNTNHPSDNGRGNYLVVFERNLLSPPKSPATTQQVLAAMATADPIRGRELFMHPRGAGCVKCHAMDGIGQMLAPDLSDLGNRAKTAEAIVASIIEPSAIITEGFAQQIIETLDGKLIKGAVIEETRRTLKVADSNGVVTTVNVSNIENRKGSKVSPMPDGFAKSMSSQQIADIIAWLLTQKVLGDRDGFSFRDQPNHLDIYLGKKKLARYLKSHPKLTRRALVNVQTPGGTQMTRNFPPRKPEDIDPGYKSEDGIIHPIMHPGIWLGFGDVNGNDFWRLKAKVKFESYTNPPTGDRTSGQFTALNKLISEDGKRVVCTESTTYRFRAVPDGLQISILAEYYSDQADFYFGDQEESGLAIRVASPIRVAGGNGTILNDLGDRNGAQVRGTNAKWFDYFGTIDGKQVGIIVASAPSNPKSTWLHARDYGVVATNPFPMQPRERREPYVKTWVRKGEKYRLEYALLIHESPAGQKFDRTKAIERLLKSFE